MNRIFPGHRQSRPPSGRFTINRDSPQAKGLVAWFLNGRPTYFDPDVSGINGGTVVLQTPDWRIDTERGLGLNFDRTTKEGIASFPRTPVTAPPFTLSVWVRSVDVTLLQTLMALGSSTNNWHSYMLNIENSKPTMATYDGTTRTLSTASNLINNTLYHIVGIWKATNNWKIYVDGGRETAVQTNDEVPLGIGSVSIGGLYYWTGSGMTWDASYHAGGVIFDARIYNTSLTDQEVYQLYSPETRWDLYLPAAPPRFWSVPAAAPPAGVAMPIFGNDDQLFGSIFGGAIVR